MTRHPPRDITPITGEEWRSLGFYHELDPDRHAWRLCGSRSGLIGFARLVARYVETTAQSPDAAPLSLGPYGDFQVRLWERPGIDDESVHGRADDLRRLAQLLERRLVDTAPGAKLIIGPEYAGDAECSLVFEIMDDDFDPAALVKAVPTEDRASAPAVVSPRIPFKFYDPEDREWEGLVYLEGSDIVMQYEKKETLMDRVSQFFGAERPGVEELIVPMSEVTSTSFKRTAFKAKLTVQVNDITLLAGVPRTKAGTIRLDFARADRDAAGNLAAAIDELLAEERR